VESRQVVQPAFLDNIGTHLGRDFEAVDLFADMLRIFSQDPVCVSARCLSVLFIFKAFVWFFHYSSPSHFAAPFRLGSPPIFRGLGSVGGAP